MNIKKQDRSRPTIAKQNTFPLHILNELMDKQTDILNYSVESLQKKRMLSSSLEALTLPGSKPMGLV